MRSLAINAYSWPFWGSFVAKWSENGIILKFCLWLKLHYFDLLRICCGYVVQCTTSCMINPQQILELDYSVIFMQPYARRLSDSADFIVVLTRVR